MGLQQNAVLESAGLALVGVADDIAFGARRVAAAFPFHSRRESGAAAPAQVRALHFVEQALAAERDRRVERAARRERSAEQRAGPADIVLDAKEGIGPARERNSRADQVDDLVDPPLGQPRDRDIVDQHRRPLIAHAGAGGEIDADETVRRDLAALDVELIAEAFEQGEAAQHPVGDVVGDQHAIERRAACRKRRNRIAERFRRACAGFSAARRCRRRSRARSSRAPPAPRARSARDSSDRRDISRRRRRRDRRGTWLPFSRRQGCET